MDKRANAKRRIIIFAVLSVIVVGLVVLSFYAESLLKSLMPDFYYMRPGVAPSIEETMTLPGAETSETASAAEITETTAAAETPAAETATFSMNLGTLLVPACGVAVIFLLFFLLRVPQAIKTLSSPGTEEPKTPDIRPAFVIPSPAPSPLMKADDEITATAASPDSNTTTAPGEDDELPQAGSKYNVEKSISLSEGTSLIDWGGEW